MVRRIVGARCSANAAWIYALLMYFIMVGRGPARAQINTVFGEISHLDELKLTKRESIRFLKRGGIIDSSDLEEIFQAIPHLSGAPRRPSRRRLSCYRQWCQGTCPSGFYTTYEGFTARPGTMNRAGDPGMWVAEIIGCCNGYPAARENAAELIKRHCQECTPCGVDEYPVLGGCVSATDSICESCPPGRSPDELYDIYNCDVVCNSPTCNQCTTGIESACKKNCAEGEIFVRLPSSDGGAGLGTCKASSCVCTGGIPANDCEDSASEEDRCLSCYKGRGFNPDDPNDFKCRFCGVDTYSDGLSSTACKSCPDGWSTLGYEGLHFCYEPCAPGTYLSWDDKCEDCAKGMYSEKLGFHGTCTMCPAGKYNTELGMASETHGCKPCDAGKFSQVIGSEDPMECEECTEGKFADFSTGIVPSFCIGCYKGKYTEEIGATSCKRCPRGKYQDRQGRTSVFDCKGCKAGTYDAGWSPGVCNSVSTFDQISSSDPTNTAEYVGTQEECLMWCELFTHARCCTWLGDDKQCKAHSSLGTDPANPGNRSFFRLDGLATERDCTKCPPGTYSEEVGYDQPCKLCDSGKFNKGTGKDHEDDCETCEPGDYNAEQGQSRCKNCPAGTYLDNTGDPERHNELIDCTICSEGYYNEQVGQSREYSCESCPSGYTNRDYGQDRLKHDELDDCEVCPPGSFSDEEGSTECKDCPSGRIAKDLEGAIPNSMDIACAKCALGTYQEFSGETECSKCPAGTYLDEIGKQSRSDCVTCDVGRFFKPQSEKPVAESLEDCTVCPSGYFNEFSAEDDPEGTKHSSCNFCPRGWYQPSTNADHCLQCGPGRFNAHKAMSQEHDACVDCPEGYHGLGHAAATCSACPAGQYGDTAALADKASACINCAGGKVTLADGETECTNCSSGFYLPGYKAGPYASCLACEEQMSPGETTCPGCLSGQYGKISVSCQDCPGGRYNPGGNIVECHECPAGYHQEPSDSLYFKGRCMACVRGKYSEEKAAVDDNTCVSCAAGLHGTEPGLTSSAEACRSCMPGRYNKQTGQAYDTACKKCPEGYWSDLPQLATDCYDCLIGRFKDMAGSTSACEPCAEGQYQAESGKGECNLCNPGQSQTNIGETACIDCEKGKFSSEPSGSPSILRCAACPKGYAQPNQGKPICVKCQPGSIALFTELTSCEACSTGRFDVTGYKSCEKCPVGHFQNNLGASLCFKCPQGYWQPHKGQKTCEPCKPGFYQDRAGKIQCKNCPVGTTTKGKSGSQECVECAAGRVDSGSIHIDDGCSPCPAGKYRNGTLRNCKDCSYGEYSAEPGFASCNDCMPGFYQDLTASSSCKECPVDFYNGDSRQYRCTECAPGMTTITFNRSTECLICPEGRYGANTTLGCLDCPLGQFREDGSKNVSEALKCTACPFGYVNDKFGQAACSKCAPGFFQNATGMTKCIPCKPLEFQNASASYACMLCPIGQFTTNFSSAACQNCSGGKYGTGPGKPCSGCPVGYAREAIGPINCTACPAGRHTNNMSNTSVCIQCERGTYQNEDGQPLCQSCNKPELKCEDEESIRIAECRFQDNPGKTSCEECEDGLIPDPTAVMCIKPTWTTEKECQLGQALNNSNEAEKSEWSCISCPSGAACSWSDGPPTVIANVGHEEGHWSVHWDCEVGAGRQDGGYRCNTDRIRPLEFPEFIKCPFPRACTSSKTSWTRWREQSNLTQALEGAVRKLRLDKHCRSIRAPLKTYMTEKYPNGTGIGTLEPSLCPENKCPTCATHIEDAFTKWLDEMVGTNFKWATGSRLTAGGTFTLPAFFTTPGRKEALRSTGYFEPCEGSDTNVYCLTEFGTNAFNFTIEDDIFEIVRRKALRSTGLFEPCEGPEADGYCPLEWNTQAKQRKMSEDYQSAMLAHYRAQYYVSYLRVDTCTDTTTGPLCALCKEGYFRESRTSAECSQCTPGTVPIRFGVLIAIAFTIIVLVYYLQKKAVALSQEFTHTFALLRRLLVINMSYFQVATSLPRLIYIEWPTNYVTMLDSLSFVNIDIVALLGLKCVEVKSLVDFDNDFRMSIVIMTSLPILWGGVVFCVWLYHAHRMGIHMKGVRGRDPEYEERMATRAITYIYSVVDFNQDGFIDDREFKKVLEAVNYKDAKKVRHRHILEMMQDIGATHIHGNRSLHDESSSSEDEHDHDDFYNYERDHDHDAEDDDDDHEEPLLRVTLDQMVEAARIRILHKHFGTSWISNANSNRIRALYMSFALLFIFFMHAPISQRYFYYFACHDVGGKHFMRGDYSLRCHVGKHQNFKVFVVFVMMAFTFAFPSYLLHKLYIHRKTLRKPQVAQKYGFLYKSFSEGAEAWEIHEITRKCILIGGLVFVERTTDKCMVAVCVCLVSICLSTFYKPHPNRAVFAVELMSFIFTCMKYFSVVLLNIKAISKSTTGGTNYSEQEGLGLVLVGLDMTFAAGTGIVCLGAVAYSMKVAMAEKEAKKKQARNTQYLNLKLKSAKLVKKLKKKQTLRKSKDGASLNSVVAVTSVSLVALLLPTPITGLGCDSGSYCTNQDISLCPTALAECEPCDIGHYSHENSSQCTVCPVGKYANKAGSTTCKECPSAGLALDQLRNASAPVRYCESCPTGFYAGVLGYPACQACVPGRYSSVWNTMWCPVCPAGRFTNTSGSAACDECPLGGVIEDEGGSSFPDPLAELLSELRHNQLSDCTACPIGKYHDVNMANHTSISECQFCPKGKFNDDDATAAQFHVSCTECPKGSYGDELGETSPNCKECVRGRYNELPSTVQASDCKVCEAGKYVETFANEDESACKECPEGTYLEDSALDDEKHNGVDDCTICDAGKYNPDSGMKNAVNCVECEPGFFNADVHTVASAHIQCSECPAGYYQDEEESVDCKNCDLGRYSTALKRPDSCDACNRGRYADTLNSLSCKSCPVGLHGDSSGSVKNSQANACANCDVGKTTTTPGQNECVECPEKTYLPTQMVGEGAYCVECDAAENTGASTCPSESSNPSLVTDCKHSNFVIDNGCKTCEFGQSGRWDPTLKDDNPDTPMAVCTACTAGKYAFGGDSAACLSCPMGYYSDEVGAGVCTPCPPGTYSNILEQNVASDCTPCGQGSHGTDPGGRAQSAETGCQKCAKGTYSNKEIAADIRDCLDCSAGRFSQARGSSECTDCAQGKFGQTPRLVASGGAGGCEDCEKGQYSDEAGSRMCKKCDPGMYQDSMAVTFCKDCENGKYEAKAKSPLCADCPKGFFQPLSGQKACTACPPGRDNRFKGKRTCNLCTSGMFEPASASTGCKQCPEGYSQPSETEAVSCKGCPAGFFQEKTEAEGCDYCPQGLFTGSSKSASCLFCPEGYAANGRGAIRCNLCPSGKFTQVNASSCSDCPAGKYRTGNEENYQALICTDCAEGSYEPKKGQTFCKFCESGKFTNVSGMEFCTLCAPETFTDAANASLCKACPAGGTTFSKYGSTKCSLCPSGRYGVEDISNTASGGGCVDCEAGKVRGGGISFEDAEDCPGCPAGYYQSEKAKSLCLQCDPGTFASTNGTLICKNCEAGKYSLSRQTSCSTCPTGFSTPMNTTSNSACQRCPAGKYGDGCQDCPAGQYRGEDDTDVTKCLDCPRGKNTVSKTGSPYCISCGMGKVTNLTGQANCTLCELGKFQGDKGRFECEFCTHDQKGRSRLIDATTKASCLKTPWVQAGDCQTSEFLNDSAGWSNRMNWSCTRGKEKLAAMDQSFKSICSDGAACDKWSKCSYWKVDEFSGEMLCPSEISCGEYVKYVEDRLTDDQRLELFRVHTFKTTISLEEVNASALYDCCRGVENLNNPDQRVGFENIDLQLKSANMQCNVIRPKTKWAVPNPKSTVCHRESDGSDSQFVGETKKTQLWSHSWVSEDEESGAGLNGEICSPYAFEYGCNNDCDRMKRRYDTAEECHKAICDDPKCPFSDDNGKSAAACGPSKPIRGFFVDKLEYTANVQFPAQDPSKYYEPEEFNCFCFDYDPKPQIGRDELNVKEEWTVFNLDSNTTVLKDLSKSIRIVNKVNSSGPVTIMQLGHKAGFWNVSWGQAERWKDPYYTSCPYPNSCLSTSDAETFYGDYRRGQAFRFGMNGSPAWHKYDLNTNKGTFYSSVGERTPSEYNGTDLLTILTHSTPNRTNPKLLFDEIDAHDPDEKIFRYEMEIFVEEDPALQKLMPSKEDQENLIKDLFERYDGNSDDIIKLHMEWLSRSCTPTTTGPMCASCKTGYYRESRSDANCIRCTTAKTIMAMVLFFSSIAALSICGYLLHQRMQGNRQKKLLNLAIGLLNEILSYYQIGSSMISLISISWPPLYLYFMTYFDVFNLNLVSLLRLDCTVPSAWSLQHTILVYSLIPFIVLIALSMSFTYASNRVRMMHGRTKRPESTREQRVKIKTKQIELDKKNRKKVKKNMENASEHEDESSDVEGMKSHSDDEDDDNVCHKELRYMIEAASAIEFVFDSVDYNRDGFMDEWEFRKLLELISYGGSGQKGRIRRARLTSTKVYHIMQKLGGQSTARGKRLWRLRKVGMVVGARKMQSSQNKFGHVAALKHEHRVGSAAMKHDVSEDVEVSEEQEKLTDHDHGKAEFIILRSSIIEAAEEGKLEDVLGSRWIFRAQMGRVFSTHASVVLYALFIMHAPVTQKLFFYFSCENIAGRSFNKGDYSLECTFFDVEAKARSPEYESFAVLVVLLILVYSFGFPGYAISRLVKYRNRLHTPDVMQKFGFLYSNSRLGAEGWLMFGLLRKMTLIGFTVFFTGPTSAAIFCVAICVLSCALLNYLKPHRSVHLFYVVLASYVLTTLKYLSTILQNTEEHKEDMFEEGYRTKWLPILIDSCFALVCSSYILMIVYQAMTGSTRMEEASIDTGAESLSSEDSSEEEWEETFGKTTTAKSKKKKMKEKLKQFENIEQAEKKTLLEQKALSAQRLTLRLPEAVKQPKLKRANSGHSAAPNGLVRWFEKVRVGLGSKVVERLASMGITSIHDFSYADQGSLDGLKLLMKKTERKRFQRGVDSIRKKMMLAGQVAEIESLDKLIKSSEKTPDNEDNTAALRAKRRQLKSKLKLEVDLSIKIKLESDIKRMLQKVGEDGTDVNERERLRASIKSAKEELAAKVAQLDTNTQ